MSEIEPTPADMDSEPDADKDIPNGTGEAQEQDDRKPVPEDTERVYDAVRDGPTGATSAAFFDLDKTVLAKSSTLAFTKKFYEEGLMKRTDAMKTAYAQFVYMLSGADHDQMEQARQYMSDLVKDWPISQVNEIVAETLNGIVDPIIYSEAIRLFDLHHEAGHDVIIISSSGTEVVEPIGQLLGADIAIGTQMAVADGKYTGEILFYAYGENKAEAMRSLAEEKGYDLDKSFSYTDSHTDLPMLAAVGFPTAANPDSELRKAAEENDWNIVNFSKPVAMRTPLETKEGRRVAVVAVGSAVALGLAWYAARHSSRS